MKSQGAAKNEANNAAQAGAGAEKIDLSKVKIEPLFEEFVDFDTFSKSEFRAVKVKACVGGSQEQEAPEVCAGRWNRHRPGDLKRHSRVL